MAKTTTSSTSQADPSTSQPNPLTSVPSHNIPAGPLTKTWVFDATSLSHHSESGSLGIGTPQRAVDGLTNGDDTLGSVCSIDVGKDAVIPFTFSLKNTSSSSANLGLTFRITGDFEPGTLTWGVEWELVYKSGPDCGPSGTTTTGGDVGYVTIQTVSALPPGGTVSLDGFIILKDYYVPLAATWPKTLVTSVTIMTDGGQTMTRVPFEISSCTGPGITSETFGTGLQCDLHANGGTVTALRNAPGYTP